MVNDVHAPLVLPALRGKVGDWVYYTCLIPMAELAERVGYARDIHQDKALSRLIQRSLEGKRAEQISEYLQRTEERFFNSLVLATYDGHPEWLEVQHLDPQTPQARAVDVDEQLAETLGFLSLAGDERIFAVDGQHRLAGIKRAISNGIDFGDERLPVIFVAHIEAKRERTRRLFTVLNKSAKAVKKSDIIALDEDDTMAITARRMVETHAWFSSPKILVEAGDAIPRTNQTALTTLGNLYDVLKIIFKHINGKGRDAFLKYYRPTDAQLDKWFRIAVKYFEALAETFPETMLLFSSTDPASVTRQFRGEFGGHALFRPFGLSAFTTVAVAFAKAHGLSLPDAVKALGVLPMSLDERPYAEVLWDPERQKMISSGKRLTVDLLAYMAGLPIDRVKLRLAYAKALGRDNVRLPSVLIDAIDVG
jgi:DNA sulfur modification protein DndB